MLYFATLRDLYCNNFQLEDKRESFLSKSCDTLKNCVQIKSHITVKKQPKKSSQKFQSNQQQEYEFVLNNLIMLNRASIKPSQLIDQQASKKFSKIMYLPEYRYLQLRVPHKKNHY